MPVSALPFPNFDPVLISIGPLAIRWYALAYIAGILLGWLYARMLIRNEALWGGRAPMTVANFDDFIIWVTFGIIFGGRLGYVLFYNPAYFAAHPLEIVQVWGGGMSFHGGFAGCVIAVLLFARSAKVPVLSLGDLTCAVAPIGLFAIVYALGRSFCEFFREPDPQLGFLWGGLTMGMVLSIPLFLAGLAFLRHALRRPALGSQPS